MLFSVIAITVGACWSLSPSGSMTGMAMVPQLSPAMTVLKSNKFASDKVGCFMMLFEYMFLSKMYQFMFFEMFRHSGFIEAEATFEETPRHT